MESAMGHGDIWRGCSAIPYIALGISSVPSWPWRNYQRISQLAQVFQDWPASTVHPRKYPQELDCCSWASSASYLHAIQAAVWRRRSTLGLTKAQVPCPRCRVPRHWDAKCWSPTGLKTKSHFFACRSWFGGYDLWRCSWFPLLPPYSCSSWDHSYPWTHLSLSNHYITHIPFLSPSLFDLLHLAQT